MKQWKTDCVLMSVALGGFLLMSFSFLLMPMQTAKFLPGILFWGGMVIGASLMVVLEARRRAFFASYKVNRKSMQKPRNGLLTFASNRAAVIADNGMVIGVAATILAFVLTKGYGIVCYALIAATIFLFCLHCVLNGRIYFHVKNQMKVRRVLEQKKAKTTDKGEGEHVQK